MADLKPLIAYLIDQVKDQEGTLSKTALVKLVYLVEVEYWRRYGKSLTGLQWRFHHYGPYSAQLDREIDDNHLFQVHGSRRTGYGFSPSPDWRETEAAFNKSYESAVKNIADNVAGQWGLENLETILEYVYFETEPMQDAERGEILDFSKIQMEELPVRREPWLSFSNEFISDLRARWDRREKVRDNPSQGLDPLDEPLYDETYQEALDTMSRDEGGQPPHPRRRPLQGPSRSGPA